jgi:uncharacterized cupin superfamily protein
MKSRSTSGKWLNRAHSGALIAVLSGLAIAIAGVSLSADRHSAAAPDIVGIDGHLAGKVTRGKYPPEMVAPGQKKFDGAYLESIPFTTTDGQYTVRVWESGPGVLQTDGYPYAEYCLVLSGRLKITNASGSTREFGPGDSFVIPKGWRGTWDMRTRFKKLYIDLVPASATAGD